MWNIAEVVERFKEDWVGQLDATCVRQACHDSGMSWIESMLNPIVTVQLFFLQVLHGNTACQHLPHLSGMTFTAAGYCLARKRLKLDVLKFLLRRCVDAAKKTTLNSQHWFGHRIFFLDGSSFSMPDTLDLQFHFGQPGAQQQGCGFPTAHWLAMMHAGSGMITKMLASPLRTHDMSKTVELHPELDQNDLLVGDRAFCSYAHFALLIERGAHGLFRAHQRTIMNFTPNRPYAVPGKGTSKSKGLPRSRWIRNIGKHDQIVAWQKPASRPLWMTVEQFARLPEEIEVRELRFKINRSGFRIREVTLVTTLVDECIYSKDNLADLYRQRWEIETNFGHIKTTMNMDVLKCRTVDGVLKELHMFAIVYNLVRHVMKKAAEAQNVPQSQVSFIDALRWIQSIRCSSSLKHIALIPIRPNRHEPRVRKRRPKNYSLMKVPRCKLKEALTRK